MDNNVSVLGYIADQPRALRATMKDKDIFCEPFVAYFNKYPIKKVFFFGSGTSYNASVLASYYFKHLVGVDAVAHYPTVFENYEKADWSNTLKKEDILFVGISQSGTSISTINVMKHAQSQGYLTLALTENLTSPITNYVDQVIHLLCGKELTPPETRGYTVTVLTLYLWAIETSFAKGTITKDAYNNYLKEAQTLADNYEKVLEEAKEWYEVNKTTIVNSDRIYVLGYGVDFASALEGQLKVGEMLRLPTIGYEIEEYAHGPTMAITGKQTLLIFGSDEVEWDRMLHFRKSFLKYTDRVHVITCKELDATSKDLQFTLKINKYIAPIMYTTPIQYIAALGAKDIGIDTNINPFKEQLAHLPEE